MDDTHEALRGSDDLSLDIGADGRARLQEFRDDGLLWLVNTALLHPRGYALAVHVNEDGTPLGLSVVGDGSEPWAFVDELLDVGERWGIVSMYQAAETRREREWSRKLRKIGDGDGALDVDAADVDA